MFNASSTVETPAQGPPSVKLLQAGDLPETPEFDAGASVSADSTRPSTPELSEELPEMLLFDGWDFDEVSRNLSELKLETAEANDENNLEPLGLSLSFAF